MKFYRSEEWRLQPARGVACGARQQGANMSNAPVKISEQTLNSAIRHAVNYHGLDAYLRMADFAIADLITEEVWKHLQGKTDVQIFERMTPEERAKIGLEGQ